MAAPSAKELIIAPASAKSEIVDVSVAVAVVPGGEQRVAFNFGEYTIALTPQNALTLAGRIQDCCQKIIDASVKKAFKADLQ